MKLVTCTMQALLSIWNWNPQRDYACTRLFCTILLTYPCIIPQWMCKANSYSYVTGGFLSWLASSMKLSLSNTGICFLHGTNLPKYINIAVKLFQLPLTHIISRNKLSRHFKCKPYLSFRGIRYSLVSSAGSLNQNMYVPPGCLSPFYAWLETEGSATW